MYSSLNYIKYKNTISSIFSIKRAAIINAEEFDV